MNLFDCPRSGGMNTIAVKSNNRRQYEAGLGQQPPAVASEVPGLVTFTVKHNNGRDIWLECYVSVAAQHVLAREDEARHAVRRALDAAAKVFPPEWPRQLCDWTRMERSDSNGHVIVRMPAAMARHILEAQERETLQEAAS